jgi:hypothetical protein
VDIKEVLIFIGIFVFMVAFPGNIFYHQGIARLAGPGLITTILLAFYMSIAKPFSIRRAATLLGIFLVFLISLLFA